jgi:hypothetical protein
MKVMFLDFDGVLNSQQSCVFWHNSRDQAKWENEMYSSWTGSLKEYIAHEFCPIAMSNVNFLCQRNPDLKVVVSSTWRIGEDVESLKKILYPAKDICKAIIDVTPHFSRVRGEEIQKWLDEHPEVTNYVIVDDDRDMLPSQKEHFLNTSELHGFQFGDIFYAESILKKAK